MSLIRRGFLGHPFYRTLVHFQALRGQPCLGQQISIQLCLIGHHIKTLGNNNTNAFAMLMIESYLPSVGELSKFSITFCSHFSSSLPSWIEYTENQYTCCRNSNVKTTSHTLLNVLLFIKRRITKRNFHIKTERGIKSIQSSTKSVFNETSYFQMTLSLLRDFVCIYFQVVSMTTPSNIHCTIKNTSFG